MEGFAHNGEIDPQRRTVISVGDFATVDADANLERRESRTGTLERTLESGETQSRATRSHRTKSGRWGQSVLLEAGKMMLMKNNTKTLSTPVGVDLRKLMKTSSLIDPKLLHGKTRIAVNPLPRENLIAQEIARQDKLKGGNELINTNLRIKGSSTKTIAGYAVTINRGKTVTIGGSLPAQVFTDKPNYRGSGGNGSTTSQFGGAGAITKPFGQKPSYQKQS